MGKAHYITYAVRAYAMVKADIINKVRHNGRPFIK
jgi:hypothetical protein